MIRPFGVVAIAALMALGLVGCSASAPPTASPSPPSPSVAPTQPVTSQNSTSQTDPPTPNPDPTDSFAIEPNPQADAWVLDQLTWVDDDGEPRLEFTPPFGVTGPTARLVSDGDGDEIGRGDTVTFDYAMFAGDNGQLAFSTYGDGTPQTISVTDTGMSQTFAQVLIGHHVGAKIIFATIDSSQNYASDNLVTMFMAVTVRATRAPLTRAEGTPVDPPSYLPKVTLAANGEPTVDFGQGRAAPHELVSQNLIKGAGPVLEEGQTAIVSFSAWIWDGEQFDSTWADGASMAWRMLSSEAMPGLLDGLVGKTVGSQVLLIIPPALAFGDLEVAGIPANSTLVYVVDLLDAQ